MARLIVPVLLAVAVVVAAGCGGGRQDAVACDDAGFRAQTEELYVTIATAQNAQGAGAPASVVDDLRKGVGLLSAYLDAHPPCDDALAVLEERERDAIERLGRALETLADGGDASGDLAAAVAALGAVEQELRDA